MNILEKCHCSAMIYREFKSKATIKGHQQDNMTIRFGKKTDVSSK